jgi:hypothetical protein
MEPTRRVEPQQVDWRDRPEVRRAAWIVLMLFVIALRLEGYF